MDNSLPTVCAAKHPFSGELIFIRKGDSEFYPADMLGVVDETLTPDKWNKAHNISKREMMAMMGGALLSDYKLILLRNGAMALFRE